MKTKIKLSVLLFLFMASASYSQIGLGIGSHGFNIKSNPNDRTGFIIRTDFGFALNPMETYIKPEAAWIKRHHYSEKTKLYAGLGISGEARLGIEGAWASYGAMIPVGLELFPMDDQRMSVTFETGLNYFGIGHSEAHFGNYGLIEITFYINHDRHRMTHTHL